MGEGVGEALEVETWFPSKGLVTYYREGRGGGGWWCTKREWRGGGACEVLPL